MLSARRRLHQSNYGQRDADTRQDQSGWRRCGLDHVQLSLQSVIPGTADKIANYKDSLAKKLDRCPLGPRGEACR